MNFNEFLPKELVRILIGFFMLAENCRGYDPNKPIGEIARHAFLHWQRYEQEVDELLYKMQKEIVRGNIIKSGARPDGRKTKEIRRRKGKATR